MSNQLGFTFYPKDWWTSDTYFLLSPFERYVYLELLFMMYSNDGFVLNNKVMVEGRLRTTIKDEVWRKITDFLVEDGDKLTHRSVNKRLARILANRENGKKGGAPKGNSNASKQPKQPSKTTQNNPPLEIEREIEIEIEREREREVKPHAPAHEVVSDPPSKPSWHAYTIDDLEQELIQSQIWKTDVAKQYGLEVSGVDPYITRFAGHLRANGEVAKTLQDARKHFSSWLRIRLESERKQAGNGQPPPGDNAWRTDRSNRPTFPGDWRWSEVINRWMNRDNMSGSDQKKYGVER